MDSLILSQGTLLASGSANPAIPGTPSAERAGGGTRSSGVGQSSSMLISAKGSPSAVRTPAAVTTAIRRGDAALSRVSDPARYRGPQVPKTATSDGPSTFTAKVLGGHLPMSWLTAGARGG